MFHIESPMSIWEGSTCISATEFPSAFLKKLASEFSTPRMYSFPCESKETLDLTWLSAARAVTVVLEVLPMSSTDTTLAFAFRVSPGELTITYASRNFLPL